MNNENRPPCEGHSTMLIASRLRAFVGLLSFTIVAVIGSGCSFKFEVTSQRTALENQVMGSYKELDDDVVMSSSVRALDASGNKKAVELSTLQERAVAARQNQEFNRDDIDELKSAQIIGELRDGTIAILPAGVGLADRATESQRALARLLVADENRDRAVIWSRIVQSNENLSSGDMPEVQRTFARSQRDQAKTGHWIQDESGKWLQKASAPAGT